MKNSAATYLNIGDEINDLLHSRLCHSIAYACNINHNLQPTAYESLHCCIIYFFCIYIMDYTVTDIELAKNSTIFFFLFTIHHLL
jgi:hypothetical protein